MLISDKVSSFSKVQIMFQIMYVYVCLCVDYVHMGVGTHEEQRPQVAWGPLELESQSILRYSRLGASARAVHS